MRCRVCLHVGVPEYLSTTSSFRGSLQVGRDSRNKAKTLVSSRIINATNFLYRTFDLHYGIEVRQLPKFVNLHLGPPTDDAVRRESFVKFGA